MSKNSVSPSALPDITRSVVKNKSLTLNGTVLGVDQFEFLKEIFPLEKRFILSNCGEVSPANLPLTFRGTFACLFPWENVEAEICLFGEGTARRAVLRISIAEPQSAYAYLSQFSVDADEKISPSEVAPTTALGSYLKTIDFSPAKGTTTKKKHGFFHGRLHQQRIRLGLLSSSVEKGIPCSASQQGS
jgi:hypothetical protein